MKKVTRTTYQSDDGTPFDNRLDCLRYELAQEVNTLLHAECSLSEMIEDLVAWKLKPLPFNPADEENPYEV
jgi:hypothetical protein